MKWIISFLTLLLTCPILSQAQEMELAQEILKLDSLIFEGAFNRCQIEVLPDLIYEDFEFYHDQHGITNGKDNFINTIKEGICSLPYRPRRELVKGTSTVFPLMQNGEIYGAVQNGKHRFYANEEGKEEYFTSIADFTHLWILEEDGYKLKRVISYNHLTSD